MRLKPQDSEEPPAAPPEPDSSGRLVKSAPGKSASAKLQLNSLELSQAVRHQVM